MFLIVIAVHAAWLTLHRFLTQNGPVRFRSGAALRTASNSGVMPGLALLPALLLLGGFFIRHSGEDVEYATSLLKRVGELGHDFPLMTDSIWQLVLSLVLLAGLVVLTGAVLLHRWRTRRLEQVDGLLLAAIAMAVSTLTVPDHGSGGGYIIERGQLYPYLMLLSWLAHDVPVLVPARSRVAALAGIIAVGFIGIEFTTYRGIYCYSAEFWSGTDLIAPNSTVPGVSFVPRGQAPDGTVLSVRRTPVHHEIDRIAAERRAVALNVWQFKTPNFPVKYRADRNPYVFIGDDVEWPTAPSLKSESNKMVFRSLFGDNPRPVSQDVHGECQGAAEGTGTEFRYRRLRQPDEWRENRLYPALDPAARPHPRGRPAHPGRDRGPLRPDPHFTQRVRPPVSR